MPSANTGSDTSPRISFLRDIFVAVIAESHPVALDASAWKRPSPKTENLHCRNLDQNRPRSARRVVCRPGARRARRDVALAQVLLYAPAPRADKRKIHRATDRRTRQRNHSADPLLGSLGSQLRSQPAGNFRRDLLEHLLLDEVFAIVDAGRGRCRQPKLHSVIHTALLESIE